MITKFPKKKSIKTTIAGVSTIMVGAGTAIAAIEHASVTVQVVGILISTMSAGLGLIFSRDNDVSSHDLGID